MPSWDSWGIDRADTDTDTDTDRNAGARDRISSILLRTSVPSCCCCHRNFDRPKSQHSHPSLVQRMHHGWKRSAEYPQVDLAKSICEDWGRNWPRDFPHINLTPKGHDLIWVLPEILKRHRSFHMFYKMEERGESLHAELNTIQRRIWCIRSTEQRLWKYIQSYELKNQLDTSIIVPERRFGG